MLRRHPLGEGRSVLRSELRLAVRLYVTLCTSVASPTWTRTHSAREERRCDVLRRASSSLARCRSSSWAGLLASDRWFHHLVRGGGDIDSGDENFFSSCEWTYRHDVLHHLLTEVLQQVRSPLSPSTTKINLEFEPESYVSRSAHHRTAPK